jgi:signal peptidase I
METEGKGSSPPSWLRRAVFGRDPKRTLVRLVVVVAGCFLVFNPCVLLPIRVEGISMMPTYKEHGINFVNCLTYRFREPRRGDVVSVRTTGPHLMYMKRIIALPGETIAFNQGRAIVNGKPLYEPYVKYRCDWELPPETLRANEYFVVGDNRSMSKDDHVKGAATRDRIIGTILL